VWLTEVRDIASHGRSGWNGPDDSEDDGKRRPDDGKHNTSKGADSVAVMLVEKVGCKTKHDGSEDELPKAEEERGKA
jgi:hypothetical protein